MTKPADTVASTDKYAKSTIDVVYGGADWFMSFVCQEYKPGSVSPFWPFGTLGLMGIIARLYYGLSSPLVLTAIAGTPAAASPATLTASKAILAPGFNGRLLFGPQVRKVPIRLQLLPFDTGSGIGWFTQTALMLSAGLNLFVGLFV